MSKIIDKKLQHMSESDSEDSMDEGDSETSVDVGLIDTEVDNLTLEERRLSRILLKAPFFPNKVGGKPA